MDRHYTVEVLKHLEKQNELLTEVHRSMSHELHKLQIEEEMLMRKFYELMAAQGLTKKNEDGVNATDDQETGHSTALVCTTDHLGLEEYQAYLKNKYPSENPVVSLLLLPLK